MPNKLAKQAKSESRLALWPHWRWALVSFLYNPGMLVLLDGEGANDFLPKFCGGLQKPFYTNYNVLTAGIYLSLL